MRLTNRGRGLVAGLVIAAVGTLGYTFHDSVPLLGDPGQGVTQEWKWQDTVETVGGEFNELPGGAHNHPLPEMNEDGTYPTNPCPFEMYQAGECNNGW